MPPISQAIANDAQTEETVTGDSSTKSTDVDNTNNGDTKKLNSDDAGNGAGEDAAAAGLPSDDTEAEGDTRPSDVQPADDENNDENAPATVSADDYTEVSGDVSEAFTHGGKFRLTDYAYSDKRITINKDTTIDLNGNMLCNHSGGLDSFFVVENKATLTIEDLSKKTNDVPRPVDTAKTPAGQLASMEWERGSDSNKGTPKSLTYYETKSTPSTTDGLGTTETTYEHVVTGFGAIDAASDSGSVKYVVNVEAGSTLNLEGGMITTAANLSPGGHVIYSEGTVKIAGGYVTNGNGGGWGGGLCIGGTNPKLEMTGGVVAGNKAAAGGGVFADFGATLNLAGGIITGNATYGNTINNGDDTNAGGYGGGVYTKRANVTISGSACITNNRVNDCVTDNLYNNGVLGGGGIACTHDGTLTMTGGSVTANYSHEAGGGIYAGFWNQAIKFKMTGGIIAGNMSENAEGGGLRISTGTTGDIGTEPGKPNKVYITNNKTMTGSTNGRGGDWGGGGIFIQQGGKLNIVQTLITNNEAGGWGGGVGACPTGETIVSHSNGAAIYNNADYGEHFSAGGHDKDLDKNTNYITSTFKEEGHKDFFLVRKDDSQNTVAVVLGKMLGGGSAGWKGTCDREKITIDANGGAEAKYMFGLEAHPTNDAKTAAQNAATTVISGNYSYTHGGGIMTNGDVIAGSTTEVNVYPKMKLNGTKELKGRNLKKGEFEFELLKQGSNLQAPSFNDKGALQPNGCQVVDTVQNDTNGSFTFDLGEVYADTNLVYYLVEKPGAEKDITYSKTIYKIEPTVTKDTSKSHDVLKIRYTYYKVDSVKITKTENGKASESTVNGTSNNDVVSIQLTNDTTFTNEYTQYTSSGSWTPKATKVVKGGEMKEFTLEFADNENFANAKMVKTVPDGENVTTADGDKSQTLSFDEITYTLADLVRGTDPTGRGASKTFTYYVREKDNSSLFSHYKFDKSVYKITVTATDQSDKTIKCDVTYTKIVNADGKDIPENDQKAVNYVPAKDESTGKEQAVPTFTNTYSTSLPLSGISGVTLTYLAGAAVLCAAAAWMHIRRKANAKGGKRRE